MTSTGFQKRARGWSIELKAAVAMSTLALVLTVLDVLGYLPRLESLGLPLRTNSLIIEDASGAPRIMLTTKPSGAPTLWMYDRAGVVRVELSVAPTDDPGLTLLSPTGSSAFTATLRAQGSQPEVTLSDSDGVPRWRVWLDESNTPRLMDTSADE